ncbi:unnamed protein product [Cuscuta europaea]|uniref:Uncharacterized protein n=1 Tax=Cuscuta europaea TaxID=41803 RepID=A0A9P0ZYC4_CUSEU|nr:unnamed protein product [Cuscuta europaea]
MLPLIFPNFQISFHRPSQYVFSLVWTPLILLQDRCRNRAVTPRVRRRPDLSSFRNPLKQAIKWPNDGRGMREGRGFSGKRVSRRRLRPREGNFSEPPKI